MMNVQYVNKKLTHLINLLKYINNVSMILLCLIYIANCVNSFVILVLRYIMNACAIYIVAQTLIELFLYVACEMYIILQMTTYDIDLNYILIFFLFCFLQKKK
eukprot:172342_1